jgi:hypothetical protein
MDRAINNALLYSLCLGLFIMLKWLQLQDETNPLLVRFWTRNPPIIFHVPRCCPGEVTVQLVTLSNFHPVKLCLSKKSSPVATDHFLFNLRCLATLLSGVHLPFPWCLFHNSYTTFTTTFITLYSIFTIVAEGKLSLHHIMCLLTHFFKDIILLYHMGTYLILVCVWAGYVISCRRVQWLSTLSDNCICCLRIMFGCKRDQRSWLMGKLYMSDQSTYQL